MVKFNRIYLLFLLCVSSVPLMAMQEDHVDQQAMERQLAERKSLAAFLSAQELVSIDMPTEEDSINSKKDGDLPSIEDELGALKGSTSSSAQSLDLRGIRLSGQKKPKKLPKQRKPNSAKIFERVCEFLQCKPNEHTQQCELIQQRKCVKSLNGECQKKFAKQTCLETLIGHMASHTNIKPFPCRRNCGVGFTDYNRRRKHEKKENKVCKKRTCRIDKTFDADPQAKLIEILTAISINDKITHPCVYCDHQSKFRRDLISHIEKDHPGKNPYLCHGYRTGCKQTFPSRRLLRDHEQHCTLAQEFLKMQGRGVPSIFDSSNNNASSSSSSNAAHKPYVQDESEIVNQSTGGKPAPVLNKVYRLKLSSAATLDASHQASSSSARQAPQSPLVQAPMLSEVFAANSAAAASQEPNQEQGLIDQSSAPQNQLLLSQQLSLEQDFDPLQEDETDVTKPLLKNNLEPLGSLAGLLTSPNQMHSAHLELDPALEIPQQQTIAPFKTQESSALMLDHGSKRSLEEDSETEFGGPAKRLRLQEGQAELNLKVSEL